MTYMGRQEGDGHVRVLMGQRGKESKGEGHLACNLHGDLSLTMLAPLVTPTHHSPAGMSPSIRISLEPEF